MASLVPRQRRGISKMFRRGQRSVSLSLSLSLSMRDPKIYPIIPRQIPAERHREIGAKLRRETWLFENRHADG